MIKNNRAQYLKRETINVMHSYMITRLKKKVRVKLADKYYQRRMRGKYLFRMKDALEQAHSDDQIVKTHLVRQEYRLKMMTLIGFKQNVERQLLGTKSDVYYEGKLKKKAMLAFYKYHFLQKRFKKFHRCRY